MVQLDGRTDGMNGWNGQIDRTDVWEGPTGQNGQVDKLEHWKIR